MSDTRITRARRWDRLWAAWLLLVFVVMPALAWAQHLSSAFAAGRWLFGLIGAVAFPIGIVSGLGIWLGFWS